MSLPTGWADAALTDIAAVNPAHPDVVPSDDTPVSFVPMAQVEELTGRLNPALHRPWREVKKGFSRFQEGDVVVAKITPSMENGKAAIAHALANGLGAGTTELHVLRPRRGIEARYVLHFILQESFRQQARARMTGTAGQLRVPTLFLEEQRVPLPPVGEQSRIVEAVDSYLSRLDAAVASLEAAERKLKAYRASVLKAAVEGQLVPTEAELARREGRSYEPADVLLDRILKERRRRWEEGALAKMKAAGKTPKDDRWREQYEPPISSDRDGWPRLPEGWCWATVDQLGEVSGGLTKNAARESGPRRYPYLRVANVYANRLALDEVKEIAVDDRELTRVLLRRGDLLVVEGNGSVDQIGRVALWDGSIEPVLHQNHLIKVRIGRSPLERWVLTWLLSPNGRAVIERVASSTSGLHTLSISKVQSLPVPLPPENEQARVLESVDQLLSVVDASADALSAGLRRSTRLRQSVLRWAFEGKLVDQDPSDEPADVLLARIRLRQGSGGQVRAEPDSAMPRPPKAKRSRKLKAAS